MIFSDAVTAHPLPFDPAPAAEARARYGDLPAAVVDLVEGTAGCSRFLAGLLDRQEAWLRTALALRPDDVLAGVLSDIGGEDQAALAKSLRRAKARAALFIALADLGGAWSLGQVTGALTALADRAVGAALGHLVAAEQARGKLPPVDAPLGGLFVLAMGKMGAAELNYSSDIDLIVLFDEALYPAEDYATVRAVFIRITQRLVRLLSDISDGGYVFRTDLRLRPDPSVTPVCIGMDAAERYYEAAGRTWERAAMIKARACAGDIAAGERFLDALTPFIWRRHLDFAAIQDAHDMRLRIRDHKGLGGPFCLAGHDVKLGQGGIREIEFFTQTRQLICGGRDPALRDPRTLPALDALAAKDWVPDAMAALLKDAYVHHRTLEHRLQMIDDAQTHIYPAQRDARARVARFCGAPDLAAFEADLSARFATVHARTEAFFAPEPAPRAPGDLWSGFVEPERARKIAEGWQALPALRTDRASVIFRRLEPRIAHRLEDALSPDEALVQLDAFLRGLPAGVQVFSLFDANPQLLDLLVDICATAPGLARYLGRNAGVLDAVLSAEFYRPLPDAATLAADLAADLDRAEDYERKLDATRIWVREHNFRIGVQLLRRISAPQEAGQAYSDVAEACLRALLPVVTAEHALRHGPPPGNGVAVIGMGKLGSREMTARSDLDLIVIYDAAPDAVSQGPKPLPVSTYFARLTKALVLALTVPTAQGTLFEVDMRLRPSGRQGPVATALQSFSTYQRQEAWTWEHLALTRARVVAGEPGVADGVRAAIAEAICAPHDRARVLADTRDMRRRLSEAHGAAADDPWEVKAGPGRMLDIELVLQAGALLHGLCDTQIPRAMATRLVEEGFLGAPDAGHLQTTLALLGAVQQVTRLALEGDQSPARAGRGLRKTLVEVTGSDSLDALEAKLAAATARAEAIVTARLETP